MLHIENVSKRYGKTLANDGVSFAVESGELAVLLGPNGAGKSTLIKCIAGLLRFEGNIEICGHGNKTLEAKRALGYIPEMRRCTTFSPFLNTWNSCAAPYRMDDDGYGEALLQRFEMWDKRDKLGKELSKGMQQKLSICCQLVHRPKVIIFDEPLVGLDPPRHQGTEGDVRRAARRRRGAAHQHAHDRQRGGFLDVAHIMMHGRLAAVKRQGDGNERSLEEMFFSITEGGGGVKMKSALVYLLLTRLKAQFKRWCASRRG